MADESVMTVQVVTPDRELVSATDATFVLAHGIAGDVGILPGHAPLLIGLGVGPVRVDRGERSEYMVVDGGFLQVSRNHVIILAEYAVYPHEMEPGDVRAEIADIEAQLERNHHEDDHLRARLGRLKALEAVHGIEKM